jgi:glycosyltransferase involved in cell wall biosynthesis
MVPRCEARVDQPTGTRASILTPAFNHARYLPGYFESILRQSFRNLELVFIDDASTDDSWAVVDGFRVALAERLARVVLLRHEKNLGLIATLGELTDMMSGQYVSILESDDALYSEKVTETVRVLEDDASCVAVHSDADRMFPDGHMAQGTWRSKGRRIPDGDVWQDLMFENHVLTCSFCCRADALRGNVDFSSYSRAGYVTADYAMFLDLARSGRFRYLDKSLARYRLVAGSISHPLTVGDMIHWRHRYYRIKHDRLDQRQLADDVKQRVLGQYHRYSLMAALLRGDWRAVRESKSWLSRHGEPLQMPGLFRVCAATADLPALRVWGRLLARRSAASRVDAVAEFTEQRD